MRLGLYARELLSFGAASDGPLDVEAMLADAAAAQTAGFDSYWLPNKSTSTR